MIATPRLARSQWEASSQIWGQRNITNVEDAPSDAAHHNPRRVVVDTEGVGGMLPA